LRAPTRGGPSSNELVDSDIVFWDGGFTFFTGSSGCGGVSNAAYIEDIAAHELGHALGLNHSTSTDATMYPSYSYCSMEFRTLAADDIKRRQGALSERLQHGADGHHRDAGQWIQLRQRHRGVVHRVGERHAGRFAHRGAGLDLEPRRRDRVWRRLYARAVARHAHHHGLRGGQWWDDHGEAGERHRGVEQHGALGDHREPGQRRQLRGRHRGVVHRSASDTQDGSLTAALAWSSNIDGAIGSGGAFTKVLTAGTHTDQGDGHRQRRPDDREQVT
jgi:hypothetical protein